MADTIYRTIGDVTPIGVTVATVDDAGTSTGVDLTGGATATFQLEDGSKVVAVTGLTGTSAGALSVPFTSLPTAGLWFLSVKVTDGDTYPGNPSDRVVLELAEEVT